MLSVYHIFMTHKLIQSCFIRRKRDTGTYDPVYPPLYTPTPPLAHKDPSYVCSCPGGQTIKENRYTVM